MEIKSKYENKNKFENENEYECYNENENENKNKNKNIEKNNNNKTKINKYNNYNNDENHKNNNEEYNVKLKLMPFIKCVFECEYEYESEIKDSVIIEPILQEELDKRFEKSKDILERINRCEKILLRKTNESDILFCFHCKIFIDHKKKNKCNCCNEIFCEKHKLEIKHNCSKMIKDEKMQIYQNAKNIFQMRLKQIKMKAGT
jgi:hypothetical protein